MAAAAAPQWLLSAMGLFDERVFERRPKATILPPKAGALALAAGGC